MKDLKSSFESKDTVRMSLEEINVLLHVDAMRAQREIQQDPHRKNTVRMEQIDVSCI